MSKDLLERMHFVFLCFFVFFVAICSLLQRMRFQFKYVLKLFLHFRRFACLEGAEQDNAACASPRRHFRMLRHSQERVGQDISP